MDEDTARHILARGRASRRRRVRRELRRAATAPTSNCRRRGRASAGRQAGHPAPTTTAAGTPSVVPPALGGVGAPPSLRWAAQELLVGANPAAFFYVVGTLMANVVLRGRHAGADGAVRQADARATTGAARWCSPSRRRLGCRRRHHQGDRRRRGEGHLSHRGREALHHVGRRRLRREHHPPRPGSRPRAPVPGPRACRCSSSPSSW